MIPGFLDIIKAAVGGENPGENPEDDWNERRIADITGQGHSEAEARKAMERQDQVLREAMVSLSPEWQARLGAFIKPTIRSLRDPDHPEEGILGGTQWTHGLQTIHPRSFESLTREPDVLNYGPLRWYSLRDQKMGDPTREEIADHLDLPQFGRNPAYPKGDGTTEKVTRHEVGHAIDNFLLDSSEGQPFWSMSPEGKKFFESGNIIVGRDGRVVDPENPGEPYNNNKELMAEIIEKAILTGIIPKSYGDDFYNLMRGVIPELRQVDLKMGAEAVADKDRSPYDLYAESRARDADDSQEIQGESEETLLNKARFLYAGDLRDQGKGTVRWVPQSVMIDAYDPTTRGEIEGKDWRSFARPDGKVRPVEYDKRLPVEYDKRLPEGEMKGPAVGGGELPPLRFDRSFFELVERHLEMQEREPMRQMTDPMAPPLTQEDQIQAIINSGQIGPPNRFF